jgi:hypothetical protein
MLISLLLLYLFVASLLHLVIKLKTKIVVKLNHTTFLVHTKTWVSYETLFPHSHIQFPFSQTSTQRTFPSEKLLRFFESTPAQITKINFRLTTPNKNRNGFFSEECLLSHSRNGENDDNRHEARTHRCICEIGSALRPKSSTAPHFSRAGENPVCVAM